MHSDIGYLMMLLDAHVRVLRYSLVYIQTGENDQVFAMAAGYIKSSPAEIGKLLTMIAANFQSLSGSSDGPYYSSY